MIGKTENDDWRSKRTGHGVGDWFRQETDFGSEFVYIMVSVPVNLFKNKSFVMLVEAIGSKGEDSYSGSAIDSGILQVDCSMDLTEKEWYELTGGKPDSFEKIIVDEIVFSEPKQDETAEDTRNAVTNQIGDQK